MNLLEKLWDDTVAGPQPDSGLGRLRKFSPRSTPSKEMAFGGEGMTSSAENQEEVKVSRKIMIVKPPGYNHQGAGSAPASPADSTPPSSPFSGSRSGAFRFRRRSTSDANEKVAEGEDRAFRNSPTT